MQRFRNLSTKIIIAFLVMICMVLTLPIANNTNTVSAADTTTYVHGVVNYAGTVNSKLNVTYSEKSKSDDQGTIAFRISNTTAYVVYTKLGTASSTSSVQEKSLNFYPFNFTTYSNATNDFVSRHEMICKTMATRTQNFAGTWYECVIKDDNYSIAIFVNGGDDSKSPFADFVNMDKGITSLKKGYCYTTVTDSDKASCQTLNNYLTPVAEKTVTTNIEDYYYDATGAKIKREDATTTMGKKFKNASYTVTYSKGNAYWGDAEATSQVMAKSYAKFNFKIAPGTGGNMTIPVEFHSQLVKQSMSGITEPTCKQTGDIKVAKNYITKANDTLTITGIKNLSKHASSTYTYVKGSKDDTHTAKYSCCGEVYKADVACTYKTTTAPTCTSDGVETCSICGQTRKLNKLGHDFTDGHHDVVPATCETNGIEEYWTCSRCKKNSLTNDVNTTSYASDYNLTIPKLGHDLTAKIKDDYYLKTAANCLTGNIYYYGCTHEGCTKKDTHYWTDDESALGHDYTYIAETPAKCESTGIKEHWYCERCKKNSLSEDIMTDNFATTSDMIIPKLGHDFSAEVADSMYLKSAATCNEPAIYYHCCSHEGCDKKSTSINDVWENKYDEPALGHTYETNESDWIVNIEPTCTSTGEKTGRCTRCKDGTPGHTTKVTLNRIDHVSDDNWKITKSPTCTEEGEEVTHCKMCKSYITDRRSVDPTGHTEKEIITAAKCNVDGVKLIKCSKCNEELDREVIPALGHTWETGETDYTVTREPNCTAAGSEKSVCTRCQKVDTRVIDPLGHEDDWIWTTTLEPTCEKEGLECTHCSRCKEVMQKQSIDALGHQDDGVWTVAKKATCGEEGRECTHCANCKQEVIGVTQSRVLPKDPTQHAWVVKKVTKQPTCTLSGHQDMICTHCGTPLTTDFDEYAEETTIPATGIHTESAWITDIAATTTTTGKRHKECTVCGKELKSETIAYKDVNMSGTKYTNTKNVKKANLKKGMFVYVGISGTNYGVGYKILSVTSSGGTVMYMSYNNNNAKTVTIPNVVKIGDVTFKVTTISKDAFKNNKKLTKVVIGKNIATIGSNAFMGCTALSTVTLSTAVKNIQSNAFNGCTKLARITFGTNVTTIGAGAFNGCKNLKTITFNTKKLGTVGKNAFKNVKSNATITVPSAKLKLYSNKLKASSTLSKNVKFLGR